MENDFSILRISRIFAQSDQENALGKCLEIIQIPSFT